MNNETVNQIVAAVAMELGLDAASILTKSRREPLATARQLCCIAIRETAELSYPQIARALGYSDHTTVISAIKAGREKSSKDWRLARVLEGALEAGDRAKLKHADADRLRRQYGRLAAVNEEIRRLEARKAELERAIRFDEAAQAGGVEAAE